MANAFNVILVLVAAVNAVKICYCLSVQLLNLAKYVVDSFVFDCATHKSVLGSYTNDDDDGASQVRIRA